MSTRRGKGLPSKRTRSQALPQITPRRRSTPRYRFGPMRHSASGNFLAVFVKEVSAHVQRVAHLFQIAAYIRLAAVFIRLHHLAQHFVLPRLPGGVLAPLAQSNGDEN